jgi:hypothetical protein
VVKLGSDDYLFFAPGTPTTRGTDGEVEGASDAQAFPVK